MAPLDEEPDDTDSDSAPSEASKPQKPRSFRRIKFSSTDSSPDREPLKLAPKESKRSLSPFSTEDEGGMDGRGSNASNCSAGKRETPGRGYESDERIEQRSPCVSPPRSSRPSSKKGSPMLSTHASGDEPVICSVVKDRGFVTIPRKGVNFKDGKVEKDVSPAPSIDVYCEGEQV